LPARRGAFFYPGMLKTLPHLPLIYGIQKYLQDVLIVAYGSFMVAFVAILAIAV
jgi:hypothetical protein